MNQLLADATKAMMVAAIVGKGVCDSLNYEAVLMCLYAMALLARVRFRANPNPSSRNLRKLLEKQGLVRFWWTVVFAKKGPVPVFPAIYPEFIVGLGLEPHHHAAHGLEPSRFELDRLELLL